MTKNDPAQNSTEPRAPDTALMRPHDLGRAIALLTRCPVPDFLLAPGEDRAGAHAAWAYPIAGLIPGALAALFGSLAMFFGMGPAIAALSALGMAAFVTGALHEDGLADCADGFWGGWTPERRLEIMRDSRIGTYGVLTLIVIIGLKWSALTTLFEQDQAVDALLVAAVMSRAVMPALMTFLPHARPGGLSHQVGRPSLAASCIALAIAGICAALLIGVAAAVLAVLAAGLVTLAIGFLARVKIGGQTGDVLGAVQQLVELKILMIFLVEIT